MQMMILARSTAETRGKKPNDLERENEQLKKELAKARGKYGYQVKLNNQLKEQLNGVKI